MRLIDADALKAEWYRLNDINEENCGARFVGYQEIARLINNAPTVQPTGDLINRADAIGAVHEYYQKRFTEGSKWDADAKMFVLEDKTIAKDNIEICNIINALPSAELPKGDLISRAEVLSLFPNAFYDGLASQIKALPSADAVTIHEDGTLNVKVPNAHKVGRVLVMDTDSHIGGGLFYPDDSDAEWIPCSERLPIPPMFCLVTTDGSHGDVIDIALYMSDGWHKASEVIAWIPLPTPYKGGDDK